MEKSHHQPQDPSHELNLQQQQQPPSYHQASPMVSPLPAPAQPAHLPPQDPNAVATPPAPEIRSHGNQPANHHDMSYPVPIPAPAPAHDQAGLEAQPQQQVPLAYHPHVGQPQGLPLMALQSVTAPVICPRCGVYGQTKTETESGGFTHLLAAALCCFICLGCIPYCIDSAKDVHHRCGNCSVLLATYHRSGRTEVRVA
ncbi:hypothetical protein AJ79_05943 [Helicocarpus griseus UAMH5409]|uniref:LITAF domain-containing protein n=1 Tax=Helicocarpus griseus UAMH5409 TaxID=1447875 RepID=A0A2B7XIQ3_9EURO|nr:hypothetical protein AJ79_05943 [Helicocarpus griseus UAMH5409]